MKYTININQYAAVKLGLNLDFNDLAILSCIKDFATSGYAETIKKDGETYYWISHNLILQELPLLGIKTKNGLVKKIQKLIDANLLIKHEDCQTLGKTYYAFGKNNQLLDFNNKENVSTNTNTLHTKVDTPPTKVDTLYTKVGTPSYNRIDPPSYNCIDNHINNNIIKTNDNIIYAEKQNFSERETPQSENPLVSFLNAEETKPVINLNSVNNSQTPPPDIAAPPRPTEKKKETVFDDCEIADYDKFMEEFSSEEYQKLDMNYYYHAVKNWSEMNNKIKRTLRGWKATVRTFIMNDKNKKTLKMKEQEQKPFDFEAARRYLNNEF